MRSTFSSPRLVRLLDAWAGVDASPDGPDFAERLSQWVNAFDAIGLQQALQAIQAMPQGGPPAEAPPAPLDALEDDVRRVRAALAEAIALDPESLYAGAAAWQQRHLELQRQMDSGVGPLRKRARQALARVSPALRKLAALDAVFDHLLAPREQALLPTVPHLAERRRKALHAQPSGGDAAGGPDFAREWRQALHAELDLRLAPVTGLLEALANALNHRP